MRKSPPVRPHTVADTIERKLSSFLMLVLATMLCFFMPAFAFAAEDGSASPPPPSAESPPADIPEALPEVDGQTPAPDTVEPGEQVPGETTDEGLEQPTEPGEALGTTILDETNPLAEDVGILALVLGEEITVDGLTYQVTAMPTPTDPGTVTLVGNEGMATVVNVPASITDPDTPTDSYNVNAVALTAASEGASVINYFTCRGLGISSLDLSGCSGLRSLDCANNPLGALELSTFSQLTSLSCANTGLTSIDLSATPLLQTLTIAQNGLSELDVTALPGLVVLDCTTNMLGSLDLSGNPQLEVLNCGVNNLAELDLSGNPAITNLVCNGNALAALDLSPCPRLRALGCEDNALEALDLSGNPSILSVSCGDNYLLDVPVSPSASLFVAGGPNQFKVIPMKILPDGSYVSRQSYPLQPGHSIALANLGIVYDPVTGLFTSSVEIPTHSDFTTRINGWSRISGQLHFNIDTYLVEFVDWDGTVLKDAICICGEPATAPANPSRPGYSFAGWSCDFSDIEADTTVTALYTKSNDPAPPPTPVDSQPSSGSTASTGQMPETGDDLPMLAALASILLSGFLVVSFKALRNRKH